MALFHQDNAKFFDMKRLESAARATVQSSSLIQRCHDGDRRAISALLIGFWPFTRDFEKAIDKRLNSTTLPREPLYAKFGRNIARKKLVESAQSIRTLSDQEIAGVFGEATGHLSEMQKDEKRHSAHWKADARRFGLKEEALEREPVTAGVQQLIDATATSDLVEFFAGALAPTEFIAEELGERLAHATGYTSQFSNKRAVWMEVHTIPHDGEPSHEDIVMDFARAYDDSGTPARIEELVLRGIHAFGEAAKQVESRFASRTLQAAE